MQFTWEGIRYAVPAHRVVWMIAHGRAIPASMEINHKDGNKANNAPHNLEVVTRSENTLHSFRELARRVKSQRGVKNTSAKLNEQNVLEIRHLCAKKAMPQTAIGRLYGITQRTVSEIHLRKTWTHVL